jgi:predicted RNA polymerase sigma factor
MPAAQPAPTLRGLVPLAEQDRTWWDSDSIEEGARLVADAMLRSPLRPYQLQAAIASLHIQAPHAADTDWQQIRFLCQVLCRIAPNPHRHAQSRDRRGHDRQSGRRLGTTVCLR